MKAQKCKESNKCKTNLRMLIQSKKYKHNQRNIKNPWNVRNANKFSKIK